MKVRTQRLAFLGSLAALLWTTGCGTAPVKSYYTLINETEGAPNDDTPPLCPMALGIDPIEVSPPYDISRIVFRPDPLEVRFYTQSHWVSPPEEMFAKLIARRIEDAHLFTGVDSSVNVSGPHLSLLIKLYVLEEVDKDNDWQGRLAVKIVLRDEMADRFLWAHRFDVRRSADKREVKSVVEVLNRIYNEQMDEAMTSLSGFLHSNGCRFRDSESESRDYRHEDEDDGAETSEEASEVLGGAAQVLTEAAEEEPADE